MGLTNDSGDVDLLGHEPDKTLAEKKVDLKQFQNELNTVTSVLGVLDMAQQHYRRYLSGQNYRYLNFS